MAAERGVSTEEGGESGSSASAAGDAYRLGHRWLIKGPIGVVFDLVSHPRALPDWWAPCFQSVETDDSEPAVGKRSRYRVRSRLPYDLDWDVTITRLEPPHVIETDATVHLNGRFPMRGPIRFRLVDGPDGVEVRSAQTIARRRLPGPLRAMAQRAFAYNHAWAMRIGGRGLQRAVDRVVAARAARPPNSEATTARSGPSAG